MKNTLGLLAQYDDSKGFRENAMIIFGSIADRFSSFNRWRDDFCQHVADVNTGQDKRLDAIERRLGTAEDVGIAGLYKVSQDLSAAGARSESRIDNVERMLGSAGNIFDHINETQAANITEIDVLKAQLDELRRELDAVKNTLNRRTKKDG